MSKVFKKFPNKILVHMKTFNKTYIRVLDHLLGVEKHLSGFFPISLYSKDLSHAQKSIVTKVGKQLFEHVYALVLVRTTYLVDSGLTNLVCIT